VVIKTPTATLTLRGTDVVVHVHPDGTTDTTLYDGKVEAKNDVTNEVTHMVPGDGVTIGEGGTTGYNDNDENNFGTMTASNGQGDAPEHRRGNSPVPEQRSAPEPSSTGGDVGGDDGGGDDGGCDCY
jgi:hypothetical protein